LAFGPLTFVVIFVLFSTLGIAHAQSNNADTEAAYDAAFEEMLRDPGDFDKTFRFAELAVKK